MPIIVLGASSSQRPPVSRTSASLAPFQRCSESTSTPSRSKITATGMGEQTTRCPTSGGAGRSYLWNEDLDRRARHRAPGRTDGRSGHVHVAARLVLDLRSHV